MRTSESESKASLRWIATVGGTGVRKEPEPEERDFRICGSEPKVGDRITFVPNAFLASCQMPMKSFEGMSVTGTVIQVNEAHRWARVEYDLGGMNGVGRECFKF